MCKSEQADNSAFIDFTLIVLVIVYFLSAMYQVPFALNLHLLARNPSIYQEDLLIVLKSAIKMGYVLDFFEKFTLRILKTYSAEHLRIKIDLKSASRLLTSNHQKVDQMMKYFHRI